MFYVKCSWREVFMIWRPSKGWCDMRVLGTDLVWDPWQGIQRIPEFGVLQGLVTWGLLAGT